MHLISDRSAEIAAWVNANLPHAPRAADGSPLPADPGTRAIGVGLRDAGGASRVIAGIVYSGYDPWHRTISMGAYSVTPVWARPEVLLLVFGYPFEQLRVQRISFLIRAPKSVKERRARATAARVKRFLENLGATAESGHRRLFGEAGDGLSYALFEEDWPPLKARLAALAARRRGAGPALETEEAA